jgi:hypothetical protein
MNARFFHSFPRDRRGRDSQKTGLHILKLVRKFGLLMAPEQTNWFDSDARSATPEVSNWGKPDATVSYTTRLCFTLLERAELEEHAKLFGNFALEFEPDTLLKAGLLPVMYIPNSPGGPGHYAGLGRALVTELAKTQEVLNLLDDVRKRMADGAGTSDRAIVTVAGKTRTFQNMTFKEAGVFLDACTSTVGRLTPLRDALGLIGQLLHPTDSERSGKLAYFQQREWRLVPSQYVSDPRVSKPTQAHIEELMLLDRDFFGHEYVGPSGRGRRADYCTVLSSVAGVNPLDACSAIIVPRHMVEEARLAVGSQADDKVCALEDIAGP